MIFLILIRKGFKSLILYLKRVESFTHYIELISYPSMPFAIWQKNMY